MLTPETKDTPSIVGNETGGPAFLTIRTSGPGLSLCRQTVFGCRLGRQSAAVAAAAAAQCRAVLLLLASSRRPINNHHFAEIWVGAALP